jgi:hypothetical protein
MGSGRPSTGRHDAAVEALRGLSGPEAAEEVSGHVRSRASEVATRYGLKHQLRSVKTVRDGEEYT